MVKLNKLKNNKDTMSLDTREGHEYDNLESFSCHSRAMTRESRNKDTMTLDARIKYEHDKAETFPLSPSDHDTPSCHSGPRAGIQRDNKLMPKAFRIAQSGRSMVEMLGVLAVIGVLSIGGVAGYSYGMDKYRANETVNQIMLRAIDLMTQAAQGNETLTLAGWTNEQTQYDFGTPEYTDDGLIVFDIGTTKPLPKRVCEMVYDAMKDMAVQIDINAVRADSNDTCGDDNEMTFYFEGGIGGTCDPACPEGQYCDNGICFKGGVPEMTKINGECSDYSDDCGTCYSCGYDSSSSTGYSCQANLSGTCTIDGKDGLCRLGQCYPKGCTTNADCKEQPNTYCASTNSSYLERFQSGETGSCATIDFVRKEIDGQTYYISNTQISWWDAEYACAAMNREMVEVYDLVTESDGSKWQGDSNYHTKTALANELNSYLGSYWIWTKNLTNDNKYAFGVGLDDGYVDGYTRYYYYFAVCR